jgi:hypothetical protein
MGKERKQRKLNLGGAPDIMLGAPVFYSGARVMKSKILVALLFAVAALYMVGASKSVTTSGQGRCDRVYSLISGAPSIPDKVVAACKVAGACARPLPIFPVSLRMTEPYSPILSLHRNRPSQHMPQLMYPGRLDFASS